MKYVLTLILASVVAIAAFSSQPAEADPALAARVQALEGQVRMLEVKVEGIREVNYGYAKLFQQQASANKNTMTLAFTLNGQEMPAELVKSADDAIKSLGVMVEAAKP